MLGGVAPKFGSEKGVALHGGVAATVAGVALHCATKLGDLWEEDFSIMLPRPLSPKSDSRVHDFYSKKGSKAARIERS